MKSPLKTSRSRLFSLWILGLVCLVSDLSNAQGPGDPNHGSRLSRNSTGSALTLSWWGQMGKGHFIQYSQDLIHWTYYPAVVTGQDAIASLSLQSGLPRLFLRLEIEDDPFNTDTDGDGIPDGWEVLHGLNPHDLNDAFGMAPGGLSYLQKYQLGLNPTVADTDGDGVVDGEDLYPNDSRRTGYIPAKFYTVTDLSSYLPDDVKATFSAQHVALDDNHNVAFFGTSNASTGVGNTGHVYKWQDGALTEPQSFSMEYPSVNGSGYWAPMNASDLWIFGAFNAPITHGFSHSSLGVNGVNTSGTLVSTTTTEYLGGYYFSGTQLFATGGEGAASSSTGWPLSSYPLPGPLSNQWNDFTRYGATTGIDNAGNTLAWESVFTPDTNFPYQGTTRFRTLFNNHEIPALSADSVIFPYPTSDTLTCYGLNNHGAFLVRGWVNDNSNPGSLKQVNKYCESSVLHDAPDGILRMNGAHQAIGYTFNSTTQTWNDWFGVETSTGVWSTFPLLDLLKWTNKPSGTRDDWDKFHSALRNIRPTFINDADPATAGAVIAGRTFANGAPGFVYFTAQVLEAGNPVTGELDAWISRELCMELNSEGYYSLLDRRGLAGENETAPPISMEFMAAGNSSGSSAGSNNSDGTVRLNTEFEFVADNLYLGFDPPQHPGNAKNGQTTDLHDFDNPQWWTVISALDSKSNGAPFNTNNNVKIWRNTKTATPPQMIAKLKVPTTAADKAAITVAAIPLEHGSNLAITGVRCKANRQPDTVIVNLYNKKASSNEKNGDAQAVLNVDVLPKRIIPLGLWVLDDNNPNTDDTPPAYFLRGQQIIDRLNEVFAQACIQFVAAQLPAQARPVTPDNYTYGETLNKPGWAKPIQYLDLKNTSHLSNLGSDHLSLGAGQLHVVLYRYMRYTANAPVKLLLPPDIGEQQLYGLFYRPDDPAKALLYQRRVFVQTAAFSPPPGFAPPPGFVLGGATDTYYEDFLLTICHEIGHSLGINLWNNKLANNGANNSDGHDYGAFPGALYNYDGTPVPKEKRKLNPQTVNLWFRNNNRLLPRDTPDQPGPNGNKRRIESALMTGGDFSIVMQPGNLARSLWIRHEDWFEANKNAAFFENP